MLSRLTRLLPPRPQRVSPGLATAAELWPARRLRLLSFNMQAGMGFTAPYHYLTRLHRHLLPPAQAHQQLDRIAQLLGAYDVVALQEVDGGSLRSAYTHQLAHLAERAGFDWWFQQLNRDFGHLGQYSNGLLSRRAPFAVEAHPLPGWQGRGLILSRFGQPGQALTVVNAHLSLSARGRARQLAFMHELLSDEGLVVLMGDLNCHREEIERSALGRRGWWQPPDQTPTYPSWRPARQIDHILVSPGLRVAQVGVLPHRLSDHCPLAVELELPEGLYLPSEGLTLPPGNLHLPS